MDIQTSKIELAKLILSIDNQTVLDKIIDILKSEEGDFWNDLSDEAKEEINIGIKQLDSGKRISINDFLKRVS